MLKNFKVGVRLAASFFFMVLLLGAIGLFSANRIQNLQGSLAFLVNDRYPKVLAIQEAINQINIIARALRNTLLWTDQENIQKEEARVADARNAISAIFVDLSKSIKSGEGRNLLADVETSRAVYLQTQDKILSLVNKGDKDQASSLLLGTYREQQNTYLANITKLRDFQLSLASEASVVAKASTDRALSLILGLGLASILLAILLAIIITSSIQKPLGACTLAAEKIAKGDFDVDLDDSGKDELSILQRSLKGTISVLIGLTSEAAKLSDASVAGRLTERAKAENFDGEYRTLVSGINDIVDALVGYLNNMPAPAMIIDNDYRILFMNKAGAGLGNADSSQLVETRRNCYDFFKTGDCKSERCACTKAMKLRSNADSATQAKPLDRIYEINYTGVPVIDKKGQVVGAFEVIVDQTSIKLAERKMQKIADFQNGEIEKLNQYLNRVAEGDLSDSFTIGTADEDTLEAKRRLDSLSDALNQSLSSINDILSQVSQAIEQVNTGSQQVSQASQALSQGATEQASSLEEITSSVTQIAGQTRQNTENAVQVNSLAKDAMGNAERGDAQMKDLVLAMSDINSSAEEIRKIVKAIDDISFQINLLALNANVEAARAGKYGKGFAVVAEEVRNLAVRSAASVKETTGMVDEAIANIGKGNALVEVTAKQLSAIVTGSAQVAGLAEEVSTASREQSQGLEQITSGLSQIDQVTQANTASAEESASAAEELSSQAQQLKSMIGRFRLKQQEAKMTEERMRAMLRAEMSLGRHKKTPSTSRVLSLSLNEDDFGKF